MRTIATLTPVLFVATMLYAQSHAASGDADEDDRAAVHDTGRNVILITWDGVRRDEFLDRSLLPYLYNDLVAKGRVYGDPADNNVMTTANPALMSLPGYQSIFTGTTQRCQTNKCGRVRETTVQERIARKMDLAADKVASIASWATMADAVEKDPGRTFVNTGNTVLDDGTQDPELEALNKRQAEDPPGWADARFDEYTHQQALHYIKAHEPRFLFIGMNDTDEWGHIGDYAQYTNAIERNDERLQELVATLGTMGEYGKNTCIILTTDHGRGRGADWTRHSNGVPYSALITMYAGCPLSDGAAVLKEAPTVTTHLDVRPTVEALLGLPVKDCLACGSSLTL